jgi:hypothetical protein
VKRSNGAPTIRSAWQSYSKRIVRSAIVQEGEKPPEDPPQLLTELERLHEETLSLIQRINRTNAVTRFSADITISDAIAEREVLKEFRQRVTAAADASGEQQGCYLKSEIRLVRTMDPAALRKRSDNLAREARELDIHIQAMNWARSICKTDGAAGTRPRGGRQKNAEKLETAPLR